MLSPIGNEARNFIRAYKAIHGLLAVGPLAPDDRDLIEFSAIDLQSELQPEELGRNCEVHEVQPPCHPRFSPTRVSPS